MLFDFNFFETFDSIHMKKIYLLLIKFSFCLIFSVLSFLGQAQRTASVSGNWNSTATWGGLSIPTSATPVTINANISVTVTANGAASLVTMRNGSSISVNGGQVLTVTNALTLENLITANTTASLS